MLRDIAKLHLFEDNLASNGGWQALALLIFRWSIEDGEDAFRPGQGRLNRIIDIGQQAQRLHKEELLPLDEVAQMLGVSAEKAAQLIGCKTKPLPVSALSDTDTDDDPLAWLLLDQHTLTP